VKKKRERKVEWKIRRHARTARQQLVSISKKKKHPEGRNKRKQASQKGGKISPHSEKNGPTWVKTKGGFRTGDLSRWMGTKSWSVKPGVETQRPVGQEELIGSSKKSRWDKLKKLSKADIKETGVGKKRHQKNSRRGQDPDH